MPNSDNDDLLAQLSQQAAPDDSMSNADVMAALNQEPDPDPLEDVNYTGDIVEDSKAELTAVQQGFRDRAKREAERFRLATDSEYWVAVCFKSRDDKDAFLARAGLAGIGDKYLDGYAVARKLGITVTEDDE